MEKLTKTQCKKQKLAWMKLEESQEGRLNVCAQNRTMTQKTLVEVQCKSKHEKKKKKECE